MFKNNYDAVEFGKRLKMARKKAGMTQENLAEELILSVDSISRIENGKVMCMPEHLVHICEILNVSSDYLYFGTEVKVQEGNQSLKNIHSMLNDCTLGDLKRIDQMMALCLRR